MNYIIHTDGGSRGNPGPAATGIVIETSTEKVILGEFLGNTTNNIAEYTAVKQALSYLLQQQKDRGVVHFFLDSELVVKQLTGVYKIKDIHLFEIAQQIRQQIKQWGSEVIFSHVPRSSNKDADKKVNSVLDAFLKK